MDDVDYVGRKRAEGLRKSRQRLGEKNEIPDFHFEHSNASPFYHVGAARGPISDGNHSYYRLVVSRMLRAYGGRFIESPETPGNRRFLPLQMMKSKQLCLRAA